MKTVQILPEGDSEIYKLDLQKDKETALRVNTIAFAIAAVLAVPMHFVVPISTLFDMTGGLGRYLVRFGALILLYVLYIVLHEAVQNTVRSTVAALWLPPHLRCLQAKSQNAHFRT